MRLIDNINKSLDTTSTYTNKEKQPSKDSFTKVCLFIITLHCLSELLDKLLGATFAYAINNNLADVFKYFFEH